MIPQFCTNSREGVLLDFKIRFHYVKVLRFRRSGVVRVDPRKWEKQFLNVSGYNVITHVKQLLQVIDNKESLLAIFLCL